MRLGTTYICVKDMKKSIEFYTAFLQKEPDYINDERWVTFDCGNCLSLYNREYDKKLLQKNNQSYFNDAYLQDFNMKRPVEMNNLVIFNFEVEDLNAEYHRLKSLFFDAVSKIMFVNVHHPYWYFNLMDPDGNTLEITGPYDEMEE